MGYILLSQVMAGHDKTRSKVFGAKTRFQQVWVIFVVYLYSCDLTVLVSLCSVFQAETRFSEGLKNPWPIL